MILDNVTIIIPEHNRPERLARLLRYYEGTGARIIVADSSDVCYTGAINAETTVYRHVPRMHFLLKVREILPLIETPYVLYCADDDFAVPTGIEAVSRFLDANPDYVVAQGHYLTFEPQRDGSVVFEPRYIRYFDSRIDEATPVERLRNRQGQYASMLYGVVRSDVFRSMYGYCFDGEGRLRFRNLFLAEDFFCNAVRIYGKYATVSVFYSARERIPGSATSTTVPKRVVMTDPAYRDEYEGYVQSLADMLRDQDPTLNSDEAAEVVRSIDVAPIDTPTVELKRRIMALCRRVPMMTRWFDRRYAAKGLKAVEGMPSYPCRVITPEIQAILDVMGES